MTERHEAQTIWARPGSVDNSGENWRHVPGCTCGWRGEPTHSRGEATRKAYAHVQQAARR